MTEVRSIEKQLTDIIDIKYITTCRFLHNQYYSQIGYVID